MDFQYDGQSVSQGRQNQRRALEQPTTFGKLGGADSTQPSTKLDEPAQRMAGQLGGRLLEYLQNPVEQQRTDQWEQRFALSNDGAQFNQAKMGTLPQ